MWAGDVSSRRKYSKKEENVTKTDSFKTCFIYTFTYAGLGERRHEVHLKGRHTIKTRQFLKLALFTVTYRDSFFHALLTICTIF